MSRSLLKLPDGIIVEILSHISKKDLFQVARVCKRLNNLSSDRYLWKEIQSCDFSPIFMVDDIVTRLVRNAKSLNKLSLCGCYQISNKVLKDAALHGTNIRYLNLENCFKITDRGIIVLGKSCSNLQIVNVQNTSITSVGLSYLIKENIKLLELTANPSAMSEETIGVLTDSCKDLEYLHVEENEFTPPLTKSKNTSMTLTSNMMAMIAYNCSKLQALILRYSITNISDGSLTALGQYCKRLECVEIGGRLYEQKLSDRGLINLCVNSLNLLKLDLSNTSITDFTLCAVSKYCPLIEQLSINTIGPVTDLGVLAIMKNCHFLDSFNVEGGSYSRLTDHGVFAIAQAVCSSNLLKLSLKSWYITDFGLNILAKNVPNLMYLSIEDCKFISNKGVKDSLRYLTKLQSLNISRTFCITDDEELVCLAHLLHDNFQSLFLQSDTTGKISLSGCEEFSRVMPECELVFM